MLSKEEIEKAKRYFEDELHSEKMTYNCVNHYRQIIIDNHIVLYKYIKQLESDKQKLIEKLEEDKRIFGNYEERKQMAKDKLYENDGKWFYCQEILSILKGENHE